MFAARVFASVTDIVTPDVIIMLDSVLHVVNNELDGDDAVGMKQRNFGTALELVIALQKVHMDRFSACSMCHVLWLTNGAPTWGPGRIGAELGAIDGLIQTTPYATQFEYSSSEAYYTALSDRLVDVHVTVDLFGIGGGDVGLHVLRPVIQCTGGDACLYDGTATGVLECALTRCLHRCK